MKIITQPTVYVISRQTIDNNQISYFLSDHNTEWKQEHDGTHTAYAEEITEFGGRLCYMSFPTPRPGGNKAYLQHIKESGHGCYDIETEVLTSNGWEQWDDVDSRTQFATLNTTTGELEYQLSTNLIAASYEGRMYRVKSRGVDLLVTPNHRMYVCNTSTVEGRNRKNFDFIKAEELGSTSHCYTKSAKWNQGEHFQYAVAALLGFAIGDGYIHKGDRQVRFHLRKERKIIWLKATTDKANMRLVCKGDKYTLDMDMFVKLFHSIYNHDGEKVIPDEVFRWNENALEGLYEGLMQSDGHEGKTGDSFNTTSEELVGQFQRLCLHIGLAANVCYKNTSRTGSFGDKPLTRLSIIRRELKPEVNKFAGMKGKTSWIEYWKGIVYCAEVPNGTLYVRRNGKPVWCGNSVLEHAVWSLCFTGVSRTLTHELVRHRAGMAYSQLSQRYVDESVAEYVEPDIIRSDEELHKLWVLAVSTAHEAYLELVDKLNEKLKDSMFCIKWCNLTGTDTARPAKTELRKLARQAARSVLPNATETKILVTANARAWRHFLEQRGSRFAEPEIRKLAGVVLTLLLGEASHIFGDYERVPLPDGTHEIVTAFRKV